jgi:hypothetical protein
MVIIREILKRSSNCVLRHLTPLIGCIVLLSHFSIRAQEGLYVPGTRVLRKVIPAGEGVVARQEKDSGSVVFRLEVLQPYFVRSEDGNYLKISDSQSSKAKSGYVRRNQVIEWSTREGLQFQPSVVANLERSTIKVWRDYSGIEGWIKTGNRDRYPPAYIEERPFSRALPPNLLPYPLLATRTVGTSGAFRKVHNILLPTYNRRPTVSVDLPLADVRARLERVTFCIVFDATDSMGPYAEDMARRLEAALKAPGFPVRDVFLGFVFFKDIDDEPSHLIIPAQRIELALPKLREVLAKDFIYGGGDPPEPVLDAAVIAANNFDWFAGGAARGALKIAIVVLNTDAKPETIGLIPSVGRGLKPAEVASLLNHKGIRVMAVQAGPEDGGLLAKTLTAIAVGTNGSYYPDQAANDGFGNKIREIVDAGIKANQATVKSMMSGATERARRLTVLPLLSNDADTIQRLKEISSGVDIGPSGLLIREGWLSDDPEIFQEQILVDRETILSLFRFFKEMGESPPDCNTLIRTVRENLQALLGEKIDEQAEIQELIEKRTGVHFQHGILTFRPDHLCGLSSAERNELQKRMREASGRLAAFLEAAAARFQQQQLVWMKLSLLP